MRLFRPVVVSLAALAGLCLAVPAATMARHPVPPSAWDQAVDARTRLERLAPAARTRAEYTRTLDRFRAIYHDRPRDPHAAEAVYSVAELLAEQGRDLDDAKSLQAALGQYEFLRTQYPGSVLRIPALLAEAKIDADDLHDLAGARERFNLVMKLYPHTGSAAEARSGLAALEAPKHNEHEAALPRKRAEPVEAEAAPVVRVPETAPSPAPVAKAEVATVPVAAARTTPLAQVTGIRHWSTSTYTRVAIDLGDEVTFEAARVPNPDRIFFDLHGARLAPELVGKSFAVTDNGFLRRIRAAQSSGDTTRVVLDVNDVTDYSAFLLPNPYRLIIDIHGAKPGSVAPADIDAAETPVTVSETRTASAAANSSGLPAMAVTDGGAAVRPNQPVSSRDEEALLAPVRGTRKNAPAPRVSTAAQTTTARPVPNTVVERTPATSTEIASVGDQPGRVDATTAPTMRPVAAVVATPPSSRSKRITDAAPAKPAEKTADGETSLIRALGLRIGRVVIDAGHGGHDSGTLGVDGIEEKDVVLDVALRLGKMLSERLGVQVIYTRSDDTFIPLETRTAIANKARADLFLSIHANSSPDASARGVETYYLNFTSDANALDVAARENAVSGQSIHQLSDLVKKIALKDKIEESREFASDVEGSLYAGLEKGNAGLKNRGVKKAPFVVLIGANMPSILAEISFVTNPQDASELRTPEYRQRVAESLYAGVAKYENSLSGGKNAVPVNRASVK